MSPDEELPSPVGPETRTAPSPAPLAADDPREIGPYRVLERVGEGGMGVVYVAEQREPVRRKVALKVIKQGMDTKQVLARFEVEHHALTIMNHPCVARVYDAGQIPDGRPYFVMEYVAGIPVTRYCDQNRLSTEDRLLLFAEVCKGVQHAHQKGVIHRDLKPSNVLVMMQDGKPVPKIIDFGVAKATGQRLTEQTLYTELGQIIGTPEYMSPEQAEMSAIDIDTRTDIYSLGVILYELLVGALPFDPTSLRAAGYAEIQRIIREVDPPKPSTRLSTLKDGSESAAARRKTDSRNLVRRLRGDLDWITMKALEKDPARRYESATQLAEEIGRHLAHEPVLAGPPSFGYRLKKSLRKNRGLVTAATTVFIVLLAGVVGIWFQYRESERQRARADENAKQSLDLAQREKKARENEQEARKLADAKSKESAERYEEIIRLADLKRVADARACADELWPAHPDKIEAMKTWLEKRAKPLRENLPKHAATLAELRANALEWDLEQQKEDHETHPRLPELKEKKDRLPTLREQLATLESEEGSDAEEKQKSIEAVRQSIADLEESIPELEGILSERRTWRFSNDEAQWQHDTLAGLVADLERFVDESPKVGTIADVEERLAFARSIEERSISGKEVASKWREVVADVAKLEAYGGLELAPQLGLVPLRRDPRSGLWEFWHVQSGERPEPNLDPFAFNPWLLTGETGLVFVLVPGGTFTMGAQKGDSAAPNYDRQAEENEGPVHEVTLDPFFISKYELTQGQWERFVGTNPSRYGPKWSREGHQNTAWNPVEQVSWEDGDLWLGRLGLLLPTEAQWEYAARGGTSTPWWTGEDRESIPLQSGGNLADERSKQKGAPTSWPYESWEDDWIAHAPVGSFAPNGFGLYATIGNVFEWCRDWFGTYETSVAPGDGERHVSGARYRVYRGGSFSRPAALARSAYRFGDTPESRGGSLGVRPARGYH